MRLCPTSELDEDVDLLIQDLFQLSCVGLHVIIHLFCHLQQHLFIFKPPDGFLLTDKRTFDSSEPSRFLFNSVRRQRCPDLKNCSVVFQDLLLHFYQLGDHLMEGEELGRHFLLL